MVNSFELHKKNSLLASRDPYDIHCPCSDNVKAWKLGKSRGKTVVTL